VTDPFFSVLLPAFNAREHIGRALRDLLAQTFRDFEILVVDDGSNDGTGDVVKEFSDSRIRLITLPENLGLVRALNAGLAEARAPWIARQDADDRCCRVRLEQQRSLILKTPEAVLFYSRATLIDDRGFWRGTLRPPLSDAGLRWDLCFRNSVPHTSAVFPAKLVRDQMGGYGASVVSEDLDLWSRLLNRGEAAGHKKSLVSYRNHACSIMGRENAAAKKPGNEGVGKSSVRICANGPERQSRRPAELLALGSILTMWIGPSTFLSERSWFPAHWLRNSDCSQSRTTR